MSSRDILPVMPVQLVDVKALPKPKRDKKSRIMLTEEWGDIHDGLIGGFPANKALVVSFSTKRLAEMGMKDILPAVRGVRAYLKNTGLPYIATSKRTPDGGVIVIRNKRRYT